MIITRKLLLVDITFLTRSLSKSLAFCEFASINFEPWNQHRSKSIKVSGRLYTFFYTITSSLLSRIEKKEKKWAEKILIADKKNVNEQPGREPNLRQLD